MTAGRRFDGRDIRVLADLLAAADGEISSKELARSMGRTRQTIERHRPAAERLRVQRMHEGPSAADLHAVDAAMLEQAKNGNVAAAKLVFTRMSTRGLGDTGLPSIAELEDALAMLRGMAEVA